MEMQDKIKLALAALIVIAGVAGFYMIPEAHGLLRPAAFAASLVAGAGIVWLSRPGKDFVLYAQESVAEVKKVVWPSRKEAQQITLMVALFVFVLALFMWLVDSGLTWLVYDVLLGRG
ncbi:preprotein translocase subunit SecE [Paludibacterium paludis]|uniref:Protein translocase subunit SecE n=1 Tax=Paludibacterium paludis TaxID=1225769 RepID=A0A918UBX3_9NEIS|nr:preprotein translocase subunit SecE [Paludibacterium paludis]GGY29484.1 protein translocase subunit SecE [Paludibacterium paludis]